jgi:hypothetical protein
MKSILYAGAALMIGASIYGFVDYKQTSQKKEFSGMYADEKKSATPEVVTTEIKKEEVAPVVPIAKRAPVKKSAVKKVDEVAPVKPIPGEMKMEPAEPGKIEKAEVTVTPKPVVKKSKKKRLNSKLFSRAPIREEQEEVVITTAVSDKSKKETRKD